MNKTENIWKVGQKQVSDFLTACFVVALLIPLSLGLVGPFCLLGYCLIGWILGFSNTRSDIKSLSAVSIVTLVAAIFSIDVAGEDSALFVVGFFFVSVLAQTEGLRRLAVATGFPKAATHLRTAQVLFGLMFLAGLSAFAPWAQEDLAAGLNFTVLYGFYLLAGSYLALGFQNWRKSLSAGLTVEEETDLSL